MHFRGQQPLAAPQPRAFQRIAIAAFALAVCQGLAAERPPVILINGLDIGTIQGQPCTPEPDSTRTFGRLEEFLRADGAEVDFFDNCAFGTPPIEVLGGELGARIGALGAPEVDLIGYSMGGLIVRSYLAGKKTGLGGFEPPPSRRVRKAVFVGVPNFGSPLAANIDVGAQVPALRPGARFTWDLARWHQGADDLRGIDSIAIAGSGGTGGTSDGAVALNSATLTSFFGQTPDRTRVWPACHNQPAAPFLCASGTRRPLVHVDEEDHPTARIIRSFLRDDDEWQTIGGGFDDALTGDIVFALGDSEGNVVTTVSQVFAAANDTETALAPRDPGLFFRGALTAGTYELRAIDGDTVMTTSANLTPGRTLAVLAKPGPVFARVAPAAAALGRLELAADSLISVYGGRFTEGEDVAVELPLPAELAGVRVTANGDPAGLLYAGPGQINAHLPAGLEGLVRLGVEGPGGSHALNILIAPSAPAIFTLDNSGAGPAAALDAVSYAVIGADNPAQPSGYVALYLTGLGVGEPGVLLGGEPQSVLYAGPAPGFEGLQQLNFQVAADSPPGELPLSIEINGRASNTVTLHVGTAN